MGIPLEELPSSRYVGFTLTETIPQIPSGSNTAGVEVTVWEVRVLLEHFGAVKMEVASDSAP